MDAPYCDYDAVILIDMQAHFVPRLREGTGAKLIIKQAEILRRCAREDIPCVVLEFEEFGPTVVSLKEEFLLIKRRKLIVKDSNSGFSNPKLDKALRQWRSTKLLLMGVNAEYCVRATARGALSRGYQIVTSPGLISGQRQHDPTDCIDWYNKNGTLISV